MKCIDNLKSISKSGLILLTMDKGFHNVENLKNKNEPDMVTHGSFSFWVNYHAIGQYCLKLGGKILFPQYSNFHMNIGCLFFLPSTNRHPQTEEAYQEFINNFGPDDFNSIKKMAYFNVARLNLIELIALFRLSSYDSTFFIKFLPRIKQVSKTVTINERKRLAQTMHKIWEMYFNINESFDLAYEIGGIFYDMGLYSEALDHFQYSINTFGEKEDIYYNKALCFYQLRKDIQFSQIIKKGKAAFPESKLLIKLEKLELN